MINWDQTATCDNCGKQIPRKETLESLGGKVKCKACRLNTVQNLQRGPIKRKSPKEVLYDFLYPNLWALSRRERTREEVEKSAKSLSGKIVDLFFD